MYAVSLVAQTVAKQRKTLAILELSIHGLPVATANEISAGIRTELKRLGVYELIDPITVRSVLQDQELLNSGICNQSSCAIQIGQLLGADRVAIGSISLIDGTYSVNIRTIEINNGKIINDVNEYYNDKPRYFQSDLIPVIAAKMSDTPAPVIKRRKKPIVKVVIIGAVAIIAAPVGYFVWKNRSDDNERQPETEVRVQWNQ
jgi:hypothetical protein